MASAEYNVLTPERVNLQYAIAGAGSRGAAAMVDTIIQAVVLFIVVVGAAGLAAVIQSRLGGVAGGMVALAVYLVAVFAVANGYFMVFEIVWNGQTPGKRVVGLRVIRENGYPLRPVDAVIRNLIRIVDWLPFFYAVGVFTMLLNNRSKRLGDFAAGTIVIREGPRNTGALVPLLPVEPHGYQLSNADATLVRDFLIRRGSMDAQARADVAGRLAEALARRYRLLKTADDDTERFLERLVS